MSFKKPLPPVPTIRLLRSRAQLTAAAGAAADSQAVESQQDSQAVETQQQDSQAVDSQQESQAVEFQLDSQAIESQEDDQRGETQLDTQHETQEDSNDRWGWVSGQKKATIPTYPTVSR